MDTFDSRASENALKGMASTWGDPSDNSASCVASFDPEHRMADLGYGLRLDYDIESVKESVHVPTNVSVQNPAKLRNEVYNGYFSIIGPRDLRSYKYLHLSVKGDPKKGFTRTFRIEMKDDETASAVNIEGVTDQWQEFVIAMDRFKEIKDWKNVKELVIVFGPEFVTRKTGTIYVDDIYFSAEADDRMRLPQREYAARPWTTPPSVDGRLNEWPQSHFITLSRTKGNLESGKISSSKDLSAWFAVGWDKDNFYVAVDVQDNDILNRQSASELWKDDAVEIYLDPQNDGLVWNNPQDFQLGFSPVSAGDRPERWAFFQKRAPNDAEIQSVSRKYRDGYQMEMAISWKFLQMDPAHQRTFGFTLAVHDRDSRDSSAEAKLNWSFQPLGETHIRLGKMALQ